MADSQDAASLRLRGILLCLAAMFLFSALDATAKHLSAFLAVPLLVWARYLVQLLIMLATIAPNMGRRIFATRQPWLMALRGVTLAGVTLLGQLALRTLSLAETTALVFVAPLLVALLAGPLLGEQVRRRTWLATVAGFVGVLLIRAFRETPASLLSPLLYVQLVWATLLGWQVFGQLPDPPAIVGMLIIGASGLSLAIGSRAWPRWRWR